MAERSDGKQPQRRQTKQGKSCGRPGDQYEYPLPGRLPPGEMVGGVTSERVQDNLWPQSKRLGRPGVSKFVNQHGEENAQHPQQGLLQIGTRPAQQGGEKPEEWVHTDRNATNGEPQVVRGRRCRTEHGDSREMVSLKRGLPRGKQPMNRNLSPKGEHVCVCRNGQTAWERLTWQSEIISKGLTCPLGQRRQCSRQDDCLPKGHVMMLACF